MLELVVILILTLANGVLAGAEIAVISVRRTRLTDLLPSRRAKAVLALRKKPERFMATVQIGITVVGAAAAAFGGSTLRGPIAAALEAMGLAAGAADGIAFAAVVGLISFLSLVFGELVPKSLALRHAEAYALFIAPPLLGLAQLLRPLVWLLTGVSNVFLRLFGDRTSFTESRLSPDELQEMVEESARTGALDRDAGQIASRAFDFGRLTVGAVMVPRMRVVPVYVGSTPEELLATLASGHARYPVVKETIDEVVGYVVARDLIMDRELQLQRHIREIPIVPEITPAARVLRELQRRQTRIAMVVDERGAVAGLVTTEDLVEELVGELRAEGEKADDGVKRGADGVVVVPGTMPVHEANRELDLDLPESEAYTTVAGLVIDLAGWIPGIGTRVTAPDGTILEVVDASPRRVRAVKVTPPPATPREDEDVPEP